MKNKLQLFYIFIFLSPLLSSASCPGDTARFNTNAPKCISDSVNFTDVSTIAVGDAILSWKWNFGDPASGINNTSNLQNPAHLYSAGNQSFNVKLVVTWNLGCKDSITTGVGIQNLPVANAGIDVISCDNNLTVNLIGSTNQGGQIWTASGAFSNANSLTPIYTPTAAAKASGTDTVVFTTISSPYCPNVSDTVLIIFNPGPTVNVGADFSVCKDTSGVPLSASITGATGGRWYSSGVEGTFADSSLNVTTYFPSNADTAAGSVILYRESTGNGICLAARDSVTVTFTALPTVIIKTEDSSCARSPIVLDVTVSTGSGTWSSSGTGIFLPNSTTLNGLYYPSAADDLAGIVTLKFVSGNNGGCQPVFDTLDVIIKPSPTSGFTSVSACEDDDVVFTDASTMSAGTIVNWTWTFGDLSLPSLTPSPTHSYSSCGSKTVTLVVTANNGCIDSNFQSVVVYCKPVASYTASGVCLNDGTLFTNTSTVVSSTIASTHWDFGDTTTDTLTNSTHSFPTSGSFPVVLTVVSAQGCTGTITQTVSLVPGPTAAFTVSDASADISQNISFQNQSASDVSWLWNFGDSSTGSILENPSHVYTTAGVYNVCLVATDASGCNDTICKTEIVSTNPTGPSGFSPNGDGQNDVFYLLGGPFKTLEFRIYNNWGELVFETTKQSIGWDGKFKGIDQAIGVYVYSVIGITEDDFEYKVSGDITLLR